MKRNFLIILLFVLVNISLFSQDKYENRDVEELGRAFYFSLYKSSLIDRDNFFKDKINAMIRADGIVKGQISEKRYKSEICIIVHEPDSEKYGIEIEYFVFFKSKQEAENFIKGVNFSFTGQLAGFTPVNSSRNHYILDIVYESGTISIE